MIHSRDGNAYSNGIEYLISDRISMSEVSVRELHLACSYEAALCGDVAGVARCHENAREEMAIERNHN